MTDQIKKLNEYLELAEKATPGPWNTNFRRGKPDGLYGVDSLLVFNWRYNGRPESENKSNSEFIAASRTMGPALAKALLRVVKFNKEHCECDLVGDFDENEVCVFCHTNADIEKILGEAK